MSMKYLGETVTIHGGGEDLVFPHHDAEIAQSEGYTGTQFTRHWMHAAMVYCGEHKMSKSLGNMVFVGDLLERYSADSVRLYLLSHHYRKPWNHPKDASVPTAELAAKLISAFSEAPEASGDDTAAHGGPFIEALANDLDTPRAIGELEKLAEGDDPAARRVGKTFVREVLGLEVER
jgi:L-cysteine:1D-myo-inositol 2-amino-2-deoxy-alpha-D-glucopyranoside ligase